MAEAMHIIPDEARAVIKTVRADVEDVAIRTKVYTGFVTSAYQFTNIGILGELLGATAGLSETIAKLSTGDDSTFAKCAKEIEKDAQIAEAVESASSFNGRFKK